MSNDAALDAVNFGLRREVAADEPNRYRHEWQDALREAYFPLDVRSIGGSERSAILYAHDLPSVRVGGVSCGAMSIKHLREHVSTGGGGDFYHIPMPIMEPIKLMQRGREAIVKPGDLSIISTSDLYDYEQPTPNRIRTLRIDGKSLRECCEIVDDVTAISFSSSIPEVSLFMSYAQTLNEVASRLSLATAPSMVNVLLDMLRVAVLTGRDGAEGCSAVRTTHAHRALRIIEARYRDHLFGVEELAREFGCTTRYLQQIFKQRNQTISDVIRDRRLAAAKRMLEDPWKRGLSISQIAFRSGFASANHFTKVYRDSFGVLPSEARSRFASTNASD